MSLATLDTTQHPHLPAASTTLFQAKAAKALTFEQIAQHIGRNEVATAAIFYGQAKASPEDIDSLASLLDIPGTVLREQLAGFPDRGRSVDMPPREPLIYRLYEIVQNYGYAYKAVLNEKFGDGIMSAISFSTKVEKETDAEGNHWACTRYFNSTKEMTRHKIFDPEHEYCPKCDEDFQTEEQLLIHKIKSNKHIVCPVCGHEFGSEGGRDSHIRQQHRSGQNLTCPGCKAKFKSAAGLFRHIEENECPEISKDMLLLEQSRKLLMKEALGLETDSPLSPLLPDLTHDLEEEEEEAEGHVGGVKISIGDVNCEAMANQPRPGQVDLADRLSAVLTLKHWPALSEAEKRGKGKGDSRAAALGAGDLLAFPGLSVNDDAKEHGAWKGKGRAPSVVGSEITYGPSCSGDAAAAVNSKAGSSDLARFFNAFSGKYICRCKMEFETALDFEAHVLASSKGNRRVQCPGCLRVFKTTAALIAHCESATTRCDINQDNKYAQMIDEVTGGFIQMAGYNEDGTMKYEAGALDLPKTTRIGTDLRQVNW
ncbi:hypothetical protein AOCH_005959 [Aspergillus ochraceoroseus]|uniref:Cyanate hydratase n=1 Tax=Aspergillus ochraceoroseus TaxID=138278 RepID=A0A0F8WKT6_9EURO|nr:hypothetical protein AOCH_005959 [Aspergillus ochraceoroseus]